MSALLAPQPLRRPAVSAAPAAAQRKMSGLVFYALVGLMLAVGMFGLLLFNTHIQERSAELANKRYEAVALIEKESALQADLDAKSSSATLSKKADELGLVPPAHVGYLNVETGVVSGETKAATAADLKTIRTERQQMAEAKAKAEAKAVAEAKAAGEAKAAAEAKAKAAAEAKMKADAQAQAKTDGAAQIKTETNPHQLAQASANPTVQPGD